MYKLCFKRLLDIIVSILVMPLVLILIIVFGIAIKLEDGGPIFYNAYRLGIKGKPFKMFKLRSMKVNAPDIRNKDGSTYNGDDDPRLTKIGRIIRKLSVDEFPQFLNVLLGDMSIIGPRPDPIDDMNIYTDHQKLKLNARPGITGFNQAYYRNSVEQNEKFEHDVYYVEHISLVLDIKIFFKTIQSIIQRENIYNNASDLSLDSKDQIEKIKSEKIS